MSVFIPWPGGNDFETWAKNMSYYFIRTPQNPNSKKWREWAIQFLLINPSYSYMPIPTEHSYPKDEDWKRWAQYFANNTYDSHNDHV